MKKHKHLILAVIAIACLTLTAGCGNKKSQKQQAVENWNRARASVLATLAHDQYMSANYDKCGKTLEEALKLDPENPSLHILSARLSIEENKLDFADRSLARARQLNPQSAEAHYFSGVVYQRWQKHQQALDYYEMASLKAPGELPYVLARSEMLVTLDRHQDAVDLLESKIPSFEHSAALHDAVGQLYTSEGNHKKAVAHYRQASMLQTDDLQLRERLALAQFQVGQYREAMENLKRLTKDEPGASRTDLLTALGECQMHMKQYRDAKANFETASHKDPGSAGIWRSLAKAALKSNDVGRAELAVRKSTYLDPASAETQLLLGYVRLKQSRHDEALQAFKKASALAPTDTTGLCMIGYTYSKMGENDRAMTFYAKALKQKPNDPLATKLLANVDLD